MTDSTSGAPNTQIIAVAHQKGGTGKTTTVCALASSMVALKPGLKVVVIDLDPQGATTLYLGGAGPFRDGAYDVVIAQKPLNDSVYRTEIENCGLVPATPRLVLSEMDLASRSMSFDEMAKHLKETATGFDLIIIDCPSGFGMMSTMVMTIADLIVIPTPPAFFAVRALGETISYLNRLRRDAKVLTAIVLNMVDAGSAVQSMLVKKVRRDWGDLVVSTEIPREDLVEQAATESKLLIHKFPKSKSAIAYNNLAGSLAFRLGLIDQEPVFEQPEPSVPEVDTEALRPDVKSAPSDAEGEDRRKKKADVASTEGRVGEISESETAPVALPSAVLPTTAPPALPEGLRSAAENLSPVRENPSTPPTGGMPKFLKRLITLLLVIITGIIIYFAIQADMLAWVMLAYLVLILIFFPVLVFLLV